MKNNEIDNGGLTHEHIMCAYIRGVPFFCSPLKMHGPKYILLFVFLMYKIKMLCLRDPPAIPAFAVIALNFAVYVYYIIVYIFYFNFIHNVFFFSRCHCYLYI